MRLFARIRSWFSRLTLGWSLGARLLVLLVSSQIVSAIAVSYALWLLAPAGKVSSSPISSLPAAFAVSAGVLLIGLGVTSAAALFASQSVTKSIGEIAQMVDQQIAAGNVDIALKPGREDVIGQLIRSLNRLGQSYRSTLQNLARRVDELALLERLTETISRTLDLQQVLDISLREALIALRYDRGAIFMWDERDSSLNMVSFQGLNDETIRANISLSLGEGLAGTCAERREVVVQDGLDVRSVAIGTPVIQLTQMGLPLVTVPGQLEGVLLLGNLQRRSLSEDELSLLITIAHHISLAIARAQLYSKVNQHAVELEKLVTARTKQLSDAIDELWMALKQARESDRVKSLLLSTVSHELRTPLATIKGNTSLLLAHHKRLSQKQLLEHLRDIEEETDRLTELISNLLQMSRLDAGMLQVDSAPLDIGALATSIVNAAKVRLTEHKLQLLPVQKSITVNGDTRRITQILDNLLDNAARYSPAGSPITVQLRAEADEFVISVKDQGIGINAEDLGRIFDRFFQVKSGSDSGRHGIGLGLAIAKGLVEAQGGRIWAESKPSQGSTFYFTLKIASPEIERKRRR